MKCTRKIMGAVFAFCAVGLLFSACNDNAKDGAEETEVTDNLPPSNGDNELAGGTYADSSSSTSFEFTSDTVKMTVSSSASASANVRTADSTETGSVFNYSWDSDKDELYFQIKSVLEGGETSDYKAEVESLKEEYGSVKSVLIKALDADSLSAVVTDAKTASLSVIQSAVSSKVQEYFDDQMEALSTYLAAKYNSVMTLGYTLNDNSLNLSQKFQGNLTDASSEFTIKGGSYTIVLNDYENLEPFSVTVSEKKYIGVPKITETGEKTGTITVDLYSELAEIKANPNNTPTIISNKVNDVMTKVSNLATTATKNWALIALQSLTGVTTELDKQLDEILVSSTLTCSYEISGTDSEPTLKLTPTTVPTALNGTLTQGTAVTLTYKPVINFDLTKADSSN